MKITISTPENRAFAVDEGKNNLFVNERHENYYITKKTPTEYLIHQNKKVYKIQIHSFFNNHLDATINGHKVSLHLKDHMAKILERLGMDVKSKDQIEAIYAPMPGSILEINVNENDEIKEGDSLLILEAMKMENIIKSPIDGHIKKIHIEKGQNVEKRQLMISFSEVIDM